MKHHRPSYYDFLTDRPPQQAEFSKPTQIKILIVFSLLVFGGLFWSFYTYQHNIVENIEVKTDYVYIFYAYRQPKLAMIHLTEIDKINIACDKGSSNCGLALYLKNGKQMKVKLYRTPEEVKNLRTQIYQAIEQK